MIDPRPVVKTLKIGNRTEAHQVLIAGIVHGQQNQVEVGFVFGRVFVGMTARRHVSFHTQERLDILSFRLFIKFNQTRERAVVGYRDARHTHSGNLFNQVGYFG